MLNKKYQTQENKVATFDYTDLASGTGLQKLYLLVQEASGAVTYALTPNEDYSAYDNIETDITGVTGTLSKVGDYDFDLTAFNEPRTISDGTDAIAVIGAEHKTDADTTLVAWLVLTVYHVDADNTETSIGTTTSKYENTVASTIKPMIYSIPISLTQKQFKKGDKLRFNVAVWAKEAGSANANFRIGHDPKNRDGDEITPSSDSINSLTASYIQIPFRIE